MREFSYSDKNKSFSLIGVEEDFPIPGGLEEILDWLRVNANPSNYDRYFLFPVEKTFGKIRYSFPTGGIAYLDIDDKHPVFAFHGFSNGINNSVTFSLIYEPKAQFDAYEILVRMGTIARAEWAQRAKEVWEKIPPSGHYELIERPGPFPDSTMQINAWIEGPPQGWEPPATINMGQPEMTQEATTDSNALLAQEMRLVREQRNAEALRRGRGHGFIFFPEPINTKRVQEPPAPPQSEPATMEKITVLLPKAEVERHIVNMCSDSTKFDVGRGLAPFDKIHVLPGPPRKIIFLRQAQEKNSKAIGYVYILPVRNNSIVKFVAESPNADFDEFAGLITGYFQDLNLLAKSLSMLTADQLEQAKTAQDVTAPTDKLAKDWAKMGDKTKEKFRKAWKVRKRMLKEYEQDVAEKRSTDGRGDIQDFKVRVLKEKIWKKISDRRLWEVIRLGEADLIK